MVGAAAVGLAASAVRPVARATPGSANARAARSVRVSAVVPGVSSRGSPALHRRPTRGRRVVVGERKRSDSEGPLDVVEIEECLNVCAPRSHPPFGFICFLTSLEKWKQPVCIGPADRSVRWTQNASPRKSQLPLDTRCMRHACVTGSSLVTRSPPTPHSRPTITR